MHIYLYMKYIYLVNIYIYEVYIFGIFICIKCICLCFSQFGDREAPWNWSLESVCVCSGGEDGMGIRYCTPPSLFWRVVAKRIQQVGICLSFLKMLKKRQKYPLVNPISSPVEVPSESECFSLRSVLIWDLVPSHLAPVTISSPGLPTTTLVSYSLFLTRCQGHL